MNLYDALEADSGFILVNREAAVTIGLNESIALKQLHSITKSRKAVERDGRWWVPNTWNSWKKYIFPFWSVDTIRRAFRNLEEFGLVYIEIEYHEGTQAIKTQWFAVDEDRMRSMQCSDTSLQSATTIIAMCNDHHSNAQPQSLQLATTQEITRDKQESSTDDDEKLIRVWEQTTGQLGTPAVFDALDELEKIYGYAEVVEGIQITAESADKPSLNYLRSVLKNRKLRLMPKPEPKAYPNNPGDRPLGLGIDWQN